MAKKLKRAQQRNRELVRKADKLESLNKQAEKMIRIRDEELVRYRAMLSASTNYICALADMVGEDEFILPFERLNGQPTPYSHKLVNEGIVFIKGKNEE